MCVGREGGGGVGVGVEGVSIVGWRRTKVSSINKWRRRVLVKVGGPTKID